MHAWIIQSGEPLTIDIGQPRPMRAMNLTKSLLKKGIEVTLISSDFSHQNKKHRFKKWIDIKQPEGNRLILIPSPGYKSHIGFRRIIDHIVLGFRLNWWMKKQTKVPDVIFVGYPPIEMSFFVANWAERNNVPFLIDVKDLWPDLFLDYFPKKLKKIVQLLLFPYFYMRNSALKKANAFCTMSHEYMNWMLNIADRPKNDFDITSSLSAPDPKKIASYQIEKAKNWWKEEYKIDLSHKRRFTFVGSFMSVFDFTPFKNQLLDLKKTISDIEVVICGQGPYKKEIEKTFFGIPNVKIIDWIDYPKIVALTSSSSGAIIPYKNIKNYTINIPNKVIDALSFGLPILTSVDGSIRKLCDEYNVGLYLELNSKEQSTNYLKSLLTDEKFFNLISSNCRSLYYKKFSIELVYSKLTKNIARLGSQTK